MTLTIHASRVRHDRPTDMTDIGTMIKIERAVISTSDLKVEKRLSYSVIYVLKYQKAKIED